MTVFIKRFWLFFTHRIDIRPSLQQQSDQIEMSVKSGVAQWGMPRIIAPIGVCTVVQ